METRYTLREREREREISESQSAPISVEFHIHSSRSRLPFASTKPKGTKRKSTGGDPSTLPGKLFVYDFSLRQLFPLSDTISYRYWSFDELGLMQVIMTVCPILSVPLFRRKRMPSFSACSTRNASFLFKVTGKGQLYWNRLPESQCLLLKCSDSCRDEPT